LKAFFVDFVEFVAVDKKVFHMTGEAGDVRLVPSQREVGLRLYELVCLLPNRLPFLIHFDVAESDKTTIKPSPVVSITSKWMKMVKGHPRPFASPTVIVFDSYYMDAATEQIFLGNNMPYMGSVKKGRFKYVYDLVLPYVQ
jgi:hypothetical protein